MRRVSRKLTAAAVAVLLSGGTAAACSPGGDDNDIPDTFGYQVPGVLRTTNAGSLEGVSTQAQLLAGRLYPGVFVTGPQGQQIPNTDLIQTQELPGPERRVNYTISPDATFSDGVPVTCSDYLLAFTAGTNPQVFGSSKPLFDDTADLTCTPGSKKFTLIFKEGRGARWRGLFDSGTVLPAHAVAAKLGKSVEELDEDLQSGDVTALRPIAEVWRRGFDLAAFDPELQVSFGPYAIAEVGERGEVTLKANEHFFGDAPAENELVVWPGTADTAELADSGSLMVGQLRDATQPWYDPNAEGNRLGVETVVGVLTEALTFPETGTWAVEENRQALSRCVDPRAVAEASSRISHLDVPPTPLHVVPHNDPLAKRIVGVAEQRIDVDIEAAKALEGTEVRVGYAVPNERHAAMVEAMRVSCEPAGITVVDATGDGKTLGDLPHVEIGEWGEEVPAEGSIDLFLHAIDPLTAFPAAANRAQDVSLLRAQEQVLWDRLPSLPLAAEPVTFAIDPKVSNVVPYTGLSGIGWNMNRWQLAGD